MLILLQSTDSEPVLILPPVLGGAFSSTNKTRTNHVPTRDAIQHAYVCMPTSKKNNKKA
jgi:hypothetical protein